MRKWILVAALPIGTGGFLTPALGSPELRLQDLGQRVETFERHLREAVRPTLSPKAERQTPAPRRPESISRKISGLRKAAAINPSSQRAARFRVAPNPPPSVRQPSAESASWRGAQLSHANSHAQPRDQRAGRFDVARRPALVANAPVVSVNIGGLPAAGFLEGVSLESVNRFVFRRNRPEGIPEVRAGGG